MANNRPAHTVRYGAICVTVWENGSFWDVVPARTYRTDGTWRDANSFGEFDLPLLAKAILDAHSWIQAHRDATAALITLPAVVDGPEAEPSEP